ncbi:hypothetical protein ABTZ58_12015 [Streptomyces sp. NPDC094143]|uniref:hypothetical protein n=1 Tax=Streptomyces sp. NPDC094143 TaxID=3155310 RepID=UPI003328A220
MTDSPFALRPLSDDVPREAAQLAERLREVFGALNVSVRRYATRTNRNAGAVSRYLNGTRVAPWDFITELLTEVARVKSRPVQTEVFEHIRTAHREALKATNKKLFELQEIQDQLEAADFRSQQAELRERVLTEALYTRERRIAELETKHLEMAAHWERDIESREAEISRLSASHNTNTEELARLKSEVGRLRIELNNAKEESHRAEQRCRLLEKRLEKAEESAQAGQEAKDASELEAARRAASEISSILDAMREELAVLRSERDAKVTQRQDETVQTNFTIDEIVTTGKVELESSELVRELIRLDAHDAKEDIVILSRHLARQSSKERLFEICWGLIDRGYDEVAERLAAHIGVEQDLDSLIHFLQSVGAKDVSRSASSLVEHALTEFAWARSSEDVQPFIEALNEAGWVSWALLVEDECAVRRPSNALIDLLILLEEQQGREMLERIAEARPATDIPPLIINMKQRGLESFAAPLLKLVAEKRPPTHSDVLHALEIAGF